MRVLTLVAASLLVLGCPGPKPVPDAGPTAGPPPTISVINPNSGPSTGGTSITLDGANFQKSTKLRIGGVPATPSFVSAFRLTAVTPSGSPGPADVVVTNPDGQDYTLVGGFTYLAVADAGSDAGTDAGLAPAIAWCNLQFPASITTSPGLMTPKIYGRVSVPGVTGAGRAASRIAAEVGFGPFDAGANTSAWRWTSAAFNQTYSNGDEYQAQLAAPDAGTWAYLYRFAYDGGPEVYCDLQGGDGGFSLADAGVMSVVPIDSCRVTFVSANPTPSGSPLTAAAVVHGLGLTEPAGPTAGLVGQVGVGDGDARNSGLWGWGPAAFSADTDAGEDEYVATFTPAYSGTRDIAFRFSLDDGGSWTYCDTVGAPVTFDPNSEYAITVGAPEADFCNLQYPTTITQSFDGGSTTVYGQVFVSGFTTQDAGDPVLAQLGYGQKNEDPGVSTDWVWIDAGYDTPQFATVNGLPNNEYNAAFTGIAPGTYSYAFRFTVDGGRWCYGDLDGAGSNEDGKGTQGGFNGDAAGGGPNLGVANVTP